jgi:hypothetical protein
VIDGPVRRSPRQSPAPRAALRTPPRGCGLRRSATTSDDARGPHSSRRCEVFGEGRGPSIPRTPDDILLTPGGEGGHARGHRRT